MTGPGGGARGAEWAWSWTLEPDLVLDRGRNGQGEQPVQVRLQLRGADRRGANYSSTCAPISTTRLGGRPKKLLAVWAFRAMTMKRRLRQ